MRQRFISQETLIYIIVWALLFVTPILLEAYQVYEGTDTTFCWFGVWRAWRLLLPFLTAFLIHNWLLAPQLIYKRRTWFYSGWGVALLAVFVLYQCNTRPERPEHRHHHPERIHAKAPDRHPEGERPPLPMDDRLDAHDGQKPPAHRGPRGKEIQPPAIVGQHDVVAAIVLILMFGMNLGVKLYVRTQLEEKVMAERERQTLEQQLEYLKYQINPHFLMNTLNNIHALIDIDPAEAQQTILDLSHLMRFVLYEGAKPLVPLNRELQFVRDYITLMRQRLSDCVEITFDTPVNAVGEVPADIQVPPMLLITFVENAFKHGVSYKHPSYVHISVTLDDNRLYFSCENSRRPEGEASTPSGGVGLNNVRQRLALLFADNYTLDIHDTPSTYTVHLQFPTA